MQNNITFYSSVVKVVMAWNAAVSGVINMVEPLRQYYSSVLDRDLNLRQTWALLHAQVAFVCAAFPVGGAFWLRMACCLWFVYAVDKCRKSLR